MEPDSLSRLLTILIVLATVNMTLLMVLVIVLFRMSMQFERIEATTGQTNRMLAAWATTWGQDPELVQKALVLAMTQVNENGSTE